jgi:hypothetical protein
MAAQLCPLTPASFPSPRRNDGIQSVANGTPLLRCDFSIAMSVGAVVGPVAQADIDSDCHGSLPSGGVGLSLQAAPGNVKTVYAKTLPLRSESRAQHHLSSAGTLFTARRRK